MKYLKTKHVYKIWIINEKEQKKGEGEYRKKSSHEHGELPAVCKIWKEKKFLYRIYLVKIYSCFL